MGTFLQIVLAVILVLVVAIAVAWWWLKRKFKTAIGDFTMASTLVDPLRLRPARIQLYRSEYPDSGPALSALQDEVKKLGFQRIADLEEHSGAYKLIQALRHRDLPIAAALVEDHTEEVSFVFFAMDKNKRVVARGNGTGSSITTASLDWQVNEELTPNAALDEIRGQVSESNLPIDLRLFRAVYEQVYAVGMDQKIIHRPNREDIEQKAAESSTPVTEEQIEQAYLILVEHWKGQIEEAALDRYRRTSKIDAVAWEEMRDWIQVVHSHIENEDVENLLVVDDVSEKVFEQYREQGLSGLDLFLAVAQRLPPDQQWTQVGEVDRPVRALLFKPNEDIDTDAPVTRQYIYDAQDDEGNTIEGGVFAENSSDAKKQIADMGLRNAKLLITPRPGEDNKHDLWTDDKSAAIAAKSAKEGILRSIGRAIMANWWIWAPPIYFIWKTINEGVPLGWGDYVVVVWAALAVLAMLFLIGPIIAYNQLLLAQLKARPGQAKVCLKILSTLNVFNGMTPGQLKTERCKILASEDKLDEALALWEAGRDEITDEEYRAALIQIYDHGADWPAMMDAQRAFLAATPDKETAAIDLAMSIARYSNNPEEAESLVEAIQPADLPEVGVIGYQYVRGMVAAHRGQHEQALRHYAQANETASQFVSIPIMLGLVAEINGHAAVALKRLGKVDQAQNLWAQSHPILKLHKSANRLIAAYEAG